MIHVLVAAHAEAGKNLLLGAELIIGKQPSTHSIEYRVGDDLNALKVQFQGVFSAVGKEDSLLIFVDLYGGSLCNVAALFLSKLPKEQKDRCACISGANLPMVLYALEAREREGVTLEGLKDECLRIGLDGIRDIKKEFRL